jgi:dTDP-4-dehydrorhamnose reductase
MTTPQGNALLITGLPGVPGWNLYHYLVKHWKGPVIGVHPVENWKAQVPGSVAIDAEDVESLEQLFTDYSFAAVVDASGNCALRACECDPALSHLLNCDFGLRLAHLARKHDSKLVRISSDLVFSGRDDHVGPYKENELVDPVTVYGKSIAEAELSIRIAHPDCWILRIPLPMGYTPGGHAGAIDWIEWRFRNGRPATLYFDERRSAIHKDDFGAVVLTILESGLVPPDLYHCGGPCSVSLYEIGQVINAVGGYDPDLLMGCLRQEAGPLPPRAGDVTIDSSKLLAYLPVGIIRPWPLDPLLVPDSRDWHYQIDRYLWGSGHQIDPLLVDGNYINDVENL